MNVERSDFDRALRTWFEDGPTVISDRVVDVIADRIARQPQRGTWRLLWRLQPMSNTVKLAAGLAAAIVVAVVAWQLLPGRDGGIGSPSTLPTAVPTALPENSPMPMRDGALPEGRYQMEAVGLSIVADVPVGWEGNTLPYLTSGEGFDEEQVLIAFMNPDGLYSDACHWDLDGSGLASQPGDVEVGPTVDDLVDALRANTSYTSSTPSPVIFGAYEGRTLELQLPGADVLSTCDSEADDRPDGHSYFVFPGAGVYAQGPDNRWLLYIVDVDGTRLVTVISYFDATSPADLEAAREIVESFVFTP